jgi:hypothetical protein
MLPNFLVIGAMNAGTTSLYHYLRLHPDVYMSETKELDFFVAERNWGNGLDWYEAQFAAADGARAIGEASVTYTMFPRYRGIPERIAKTIPDARLIYVVRDPIERMKTQYLQFRFPKRIQYADFERERRPSDRAFLENPFFVDCSRYAYQIDQYLEHFERGQLLVVTSEDLRNRRVETVRRIYAFLGVDPEFVPEALNEEFHRSARMRVPRSLAWSLRRIPGYDRLARRLPRPVRKLKARVSTMTYERAQAEITEGTRRRLEEILREDVARLRTFVGDGFDGWGIV